MRKKYRVSRSHLERFIRSYFRVVPDRSTEAEITFVCPEGDCGDRSGNRSVNTRTLQTNCWRCGKGGDLLAWMRRAGYEVEDTFEEAEESVGDLDSVSLKEGNDRRVCAYMQEVRLPKGFIPLAEQPDSGYARLIANMAKRKNLTLDHFIAMGAGFTRTDPAWEPYCIFPVYDGGRIVYFQGRTYTDIPGKVTKKFPSNKEVPFGARHWVYDIDRLRQGGRVAILVESMFNVESLKDALGPACSMVPVGVFKHNISPEQLHKILECKEIEEVCVFFDPDAAAVALREVRKFSGLVKVTVVPPMPDGKDANDDVELALEYLERRRVVSSSTEIDAVLSSL